MSRKRIKAEDLESLYDLAWGQFKEDRDAVKQIYDKLRDHVFDHPTSSWYNLFVKYFLVLPI